MGNYLLADDPDQIAQMRARVKELLEYDTLEGFEMQRQFLQGLMRLLNDDCDVFMKNKGLQLLLPFLDSNDVKVQAAVAGVVAKVSMKDDTYACVLIQEGAARAMIILCGSEVKQVVLSALGCLANLCKSEDNALEMAEELLFFEALEHCMNAINDRDINKMAATALANFGSHVKARSTMREHGVLKIICEALEMREEDPEIYPQVARAFAAMAMESECQVDIVQGRHIDLVLKMYGNDLQEAKEFGMIALLNIALNGENKEAMLMNDECQAAISHIHQTASPNLRKMAEGVIKRLKEESVSKMDDDVE